MIASLLSFVLLKLIIRLPIAIAMNGVGAETLQGQAASGWSQHLLNFMDCLPLPVVLRLIGRLVVPNFCFKFDQ